MSGETTRRFAWCEVPTPVVDLTLATSDEGVVAVTFGRPGPALRELSKHAAVQRGGAGDELLTEAARQLTEWGAGARKEFTVPLDWSLTSGVQRTVLRVLHDTVPYGESVSYGDLADRAGIPGGARLVGQIMGSNPLPVIVPCHRVLASDGLGGFGGGVETKRRMLVLEGVLTPSLFD